MQLDGNRDSDWQHCIPDHSLFFHFNPLLSLFGTVSVIFLQDKSFLEKASVKMNQFVSSSPRFSTI